MRLLSCFQYYTDPLIRVAGKYLMNSEMKSGAFCCDLENKTNNLGKVPQKMCRTIELRFLYASM